MKKLIFLLFPINVFSQTVTLSPIGNTPVNGIPVTVEHYVNYVPNHSISSVAYNPVATTGTAVGLTDDSNVGPFPIGFSFEFYGQTFTQFRICTNGFITFGDQSGRYSPGAFPEAAAPNGVIAAYWTDLFPSSGYFARYRTEGTAPNRMMIHSARLTWYSNRNAWVDYQIVLFEGTNKIQTTIISQGWTTTATQGVENHTGTLAATPPGRNLSSFNGAGTTFEYTPTPPLQGWESQGTSFTNTNGQVNFSNSFNWPYRVTVDTRNVATPIQSNSLKYMSHKIMFPITLSAWDYYSCDCNLDGIIGLYDLKLCANLYQSNIQVNRYIFSSSEKLDIESNPQTNYFNIYSPTQLRTFSNENIFYIMGPSTIPTNNPTLTTIIE
jgi:hypothetical protein